MKTLVLIGMMGAGKTTIGSTLANTLNVPFYDNDHEIEKVSGKSIHKIFKQNGEAAFRKLEAEVFNNLLDKDICVIATGGGTFLDKNTRRQIKKKATSIWIYAPLELMLERAQKSNHRPLLMGNNAFGVFEKLYRERKAIYAKADIHIENADHSGQRTVQNILSALKQKT